MGSRIIAGADLSRFAVVRIAEELADRDGVPTLIVEGCPLGRIGESIGYLTERATAGDVLQDEHEDGAKRIILLEASNVARGRPPLREAYRAWRPGREIKP